MDLCALIVIIFTFILRSNKLLWSIISNKVVLSSDAVLKDELDAHIEEFKQLLGKNKPRNKEESGEKQIGKIGILLVMFSISFCVAISNL